MATGIYNVPGYTPRQSAGSAFSAPGARSFSAPAVDPAMRARMRTGSQVAESGLLRRGATLGQKYQPLRTGQVASTRAKLSRYGGYNVGDDGSVSTDPNARPGQAYRDAYGDERDAANARGMMDSSFTAKRIGAAWGRLSAEAQEIVTQHAVSFNQLMLSEGQEFDEINQGLQQLYGDEAQYMLDHPPPLPEPQAAPTSSPAGASAAPAGVAPGAMSPGFRNVAGGVLTSYRKGDLTPANRKKLLSQFPGYTIAVSGDGRVVMKKASA